MKVVILCGGKGTRSYPYTDFFPKPMLYINGRPILYYIMQGYAKQGQKNFILSLGYLKEVIIDYFDKKSTDWEIELVDTGDDTDTAGRIYNCREILGDTFMATYADGISDVSIKKLLEFHESHDGLATVTSVPLVSQYGTMDLDKDGRVEFFREKPVLKDHWINAGFFVFSKKVFNYWSGGNLEKEVLPKLSEKGLVYAYQHHGYFKSMDTHKDREELRKILADKEWLSL